METGNALIPNFLFCFLGSYSIFEVESTIHDTQDGLRVEVRTLLFLRGHKMPYTN